MYIYIFIYSGKASCLRTFHPLFFFPGVAPKMLFFTCIFVFTMECVDSYWSVEPIFV